MSKNENFTKSDFCGGHDERIQLKVLFYEANLFLERKTKQNKIKNCFKINIGSYSTFYKMVKGLYFFYLLGRKFYI